jgi:hypothetical protein
MPDPKTKKRIINTPINETGFNLPLPTLVQGIDASGKNFQEKTVLSYISNSGSSFWLNTKVTSGSELRLTVDLPSKLSDDKDLKLVIKGEVIFLESPKKENPKLRVSLKFNNKYIIEASK